jgi:hypothetical protein
MQLIDEIRTYLTSKGFSETITLAEAPPVPDTLLSIFDTGGYPPDLDIPFSNPTIMFHLRSKEYSTAIDLAWRVYNLFNRKSMFQMGAVYVLTSTSLQPPIPLGKDDAGREIISVNVRFKLQDL